ncbi:Negative regulator of mitotic exit [Mortierella polycephala]|uniref:Negative regulator of mitotic exit n=1 Tax=Mortierella polycephala TaxID=41804 RepID=A0A9P6PLX8_9FUNG|nr:Negative regulator of mitotic exit [Mortierella polycephala]
MAGLFSKKTKKEKDDASSTNSSTHRYQTTRPSNSTIDYSPYSQQQQQQYHPSSSKNSLQHHQNNNNNYHSATSFSTHQSTSTISGPWSSGLVMSTNPFPRFAHTASYVTTGTDIYVFGGIVKGSAQKDVHVIDSQSLHCQLLPCSGNGPSATSGHTAVTLGQYVMYFGGKDAKGKTSDSLYVLHTVRKEWNRPQIQTLLPAPRHSHAACVIGTVMYITGGQLSGYYMNDIAAFDLKTLNGKRPAWTMLAPKSELPPARAGHCATAYDGKVYIFGGSDDKYYYNDIWCYDPQTSRWDAIPAFGTLPAGRQGHAVCVIDDTMYIYGGMDHKDQLLGDLCAFKFTERRWIAFQSPVEAASPRTEHAMCSVGNKIYILGGQLDLNATEDPGVVYVLDTTKIRWNEPTVVGSQRSVHDNDSAQHMEAARGEISTVSYGNVSATQGSARHHQTDYSQDQQYNQQHQYYQDASNYQHPQHRQQRQPHSDALDNESHTRFEDPQSGRQSPEFEETTHVARRRTMGKPLDYVVSEIETRGTQSVDEVRRSASTSEDERDDRAQSHSQNQRQISSVQGQNNDAEIRGRSYSQQSQSNCSNSQDRNENLSRMGTPLLQQQQQYAHLDMSRQLSTRASIESMNRQGSHTTNTHMQSNVRTSLDTSQPSPLRVVNPDSEGGRSSRSTPVPSKDQSQQLQQHEHRPKENELKDLQQREQWLLAEVSMARKRMGERPLSMAILALEDELEACDVDSEKYRIMQALLNVKAELERSKTSIATQAQVASNKVREAERVRTSALQEAAYLKAKVNALQSGEISALVSTETARAADLEKRLTAALGQLDRYESQFVQYETILEHERLTREDTEAREKDASCRAEEAQLAHIRAMNELATLHERASSAETSLREFAAKSASSEAGLSSYQQQSAALFSQISNLKTAVDHQKKSLEKAKMAYAVANERAEHADRMWTQSRQEMDDTRLEFASARAESDRAQREAEHWRSKASETELLWQKTKKENGAMRALLEEDMNASYSSSEGSTLKDRKHDSIMAITSASRVTELEHELSTLRELLKESQSAAMQANKDLSDTMIRVSQLEQSSMAARAESATAQRQLTEAHNKVSMLQTQLIRKDETIEDMIKEQENNEIQLGLLRGVMKENGLLADDLILEALNQSANGKLPSGASPLKMKIQEAEKRATEAESQLEDLKQMKKRQEERIQQLEADYQTAMHYVQGTESMLQRLKDDVQTAKDEKSELRQNLEELETAHANCASAAADNRHGHGESTSGLEEEVADLHLQLHASHERTLELQHSVGVLSAQLQESESQTEVSQMGSRSLKAKHHEHSKRGVDQTDQFQSRVQQLEQSLTETRRRLETSQEELENAHELNKVTGQELEDALDALKKQRPAGQAPGSRAGSSSARRQEELEVAVDNAQRTIQSLQNTNQNLEEQLRASENKISLLLDNFQAPESARNSMASLAGLTGGLSPLLTGEEYVRMTESHQQHYQPMMMASSPPTSSSFRSHMVMHTPPSSSSATPTLASPTGTTGANSASMSVKTSSRSAENSSLTNLQKLEEYEKMIEEMTNARRQYED